MVESGGGYPPDWTSGVDGHGTVLGFSWLPWPLDEIKSRRDGPRTGNRHFILKKVKFYSRSRKIVTVLRHEESSFVFWGVGRAQERERRC